MVHVGCLLQARSSNGCLHSQSQWMKQCRRKCFFKRSSWEIFCFVSIFLPEVCLLWQAGQERNFLHSVLCFFLSPLCLSFIHFTVSSSSLHWAQSRRGCSNGGWCSRPKSSPQPTFWTLWVMELRVCLWLQHWKDWGWAVRSPGLWDTWALWHWGVHWSHFYDQEWKRKSAMNMWQFPTEAVIKTVYLLTGPLCSLWAARYASWAGSSQCSRYVLSTKPLMKGLCWWWAWGNGAFLTSPASSLKNVRHKKIRAKMTSHYFNYYMFGFLYLAEVCSTSDGYVHLRGPEVWSSCLGMRYLNILLQKTHKNQIVSLMFEGFIPESGSHIMLPYKKMCTCSETVCLSLVWLHPIIWHHK